MALRWWPWLLPVWQGTAGGSSGRRGRGAERGWNSVMVMLWSHGCLPTVGYPVGRWHVVRGHGSAGAGLAARFGLGREDAGAGGLERGLLWAEPSPASPRGFPSALQGGGSYPTLSAACFCIACPFNARLQTGCRGEGAGARQLSYWDQSGAFLGETEQAEGTDWVVAMDACRRGGTDPALGCCCTNLT